MYNDLIQRRPIIRILGVLSRTQVTKKDDILIASREVYNDYYEKQWITERRAYYDD